MIKLFSKLAPKLYLNFIRVQPLLFAISVLVATLPFLLETAGILSLIPLLKSTSSGLVELPTFSSDQPLTLNVTQMLLLLFGLFSLQWLTSTAKVFLATAWSNRIISTYKIKLFDQLSKKEALETLIQNKGVWLQLFQSEFKHLGLALISTIYLAAATGFTIIILISLWCLSPNLSLLLIPLGILVALSILISNKWVQHYAQNAQLQQQHEASFLLENWKHPIALTLYQAKSWMKAQYQKVLASSQHAATMHLSFTFSAPHWTRWVIFMCILTLLSTHYLLPNHSRMPTETLITYLIVLSRLQPITYTLSHDLANLVTGQVAWNAIQPLLEENFITHHGQQVTFEKELKVENLSYSYIERLQILGPHQFSIIKGNIFGIYGPTGVGKSTLMYMLMGLLKPHTGTIKLDDIDYTESDRNSLWDIIAYVPQDSDFFQMSLRDNLCLGRNYTDELILKKAEDLGLSHWIQSLPNRLNQMLYPDGKNLSGGQKKKLMMLRAILRNPQLLFLDEPCVGLDANSKQEWIGVLKNLPKNLTAIIITHDLELLKICNHVYEIKN